MNESRPAWIEQGQLLEITVSLGRRGTHVFSSIVHTVGSRSLLITAPQTKGMLLPLRIGSPLEVVFLQGSHVIMFHSQIQERGKMGNIHTLRLSSPPVIASTTREAYRLDISLPISIIDMTDTASGIKKYYPTFHQPAYTYDISTGGLSFSPAEEIPPGSRLHLEVNLQDAGALDIQGIVRRSYLRSPSSAPPVVLPTRPSLLQAVPLQHNHENHTTQEKPQKAQKPKTAHTKNSPPSHVVGIEFAPAQDASQMRIGAFLFRQQQELRRRHLH